MASESQSNGLGFGSVLFLIFLVLKLTDCINWSWWWVTSPLWLPVSLMIVIALIIAVIKVYRK